jgi:type IV pilus assembly protein PilW
MTMRCTYMRPVARQTGLSLIELMIAMVVGLILFAGALSIFISSRQSYGINTAIGHVQENGRFALDYIYNDARMAGYMGCATSAQMVNYLNPVAGSNLAYDFTTGLTGYEYTGTAPNDTYPVSPAIPSENPNPDNNTGDWSPILDSTLQNLVIPGTDVLLVRFSQGVDPVYITSIPGSPSPNSPSADFNINTNGGLQAGQLLVITNCLSAVVLQATQINGGGTNVVHNTGNSVTPGNAIQGLPSAYVGAQVMLSPTTVVFFIGKGADKSPALFQAVTDTSQPNGFSYEELVPGVEDMQVLYGVDTTGNHSPTEYDTAAAVAAANEWSNVVSVRISLLVRSNLGAVPLPAVTPTYDLLGTNFIVPRDTRLRKIFTATIAIRNRLQ